MLSEVDIWPTFGNGHTGQGTAGSRATTCFRNWKRACPDAGVRFGELVMLNKVVALAYGHFEAGPKAARALPSAVGRIAAVGRCGHRTSTGTLLTAIQGQLPYPTSCSFGCLSRNLRSTRTYHTCPSCRLVNVLRAHVRQAPAPSSPRIPWAQHGLQYACMCIIVTGTAQQHSFDPLQSPSPIQVGLQDWSIGAFPCFPE